jgi:hypothetical protein
VAAYDNGGGIPTKTKLNNETSRFLESAPILRHSFVPAEAIVVFPPDLAYLEL